MVPSIGIMVAAYIVLRCLDVICCHRDRYATAGAYVLMASAAGVTLVVTVVAGLSLL